MLEATQPAAGSLQSLYDSVVPKSVSFSHADSAVELSKSSHNPLVAMHATQMWKFVGKLMSDILIFW